MASKADQAKKEAIHKLLDSNDRAVDRALVAIFKFQTADERASEQTRHTNNVGFSGADAPFLSSLAKAALRFGGLTERQRFFARKRIKSYWRQLAAIAEANGRAVS